MKFIKARHIIILVVLAVFLLVFKPLYLPGKSGIPVGLVNKFSYSNSKPKNNDLVALKMAGSSVLNIARVIAGPDDLVEIKTGQVWVNDQNLRDYKLPDNLNYPSKGNAEDEFFVLTYQADLASVSDFGRVKRERILGKVHTW